jgi:hypothetical protein
MIVYKYLDPARIDVLEQGRIRFTQPGALNDPFETLPCFTQYKQALLKSLHVGAQKKFGAEAAQATLTERQALIDRALLDIPKSMSRHFVLLSLSKVRNNLLMWSHYTDSHRGFVIGFDSNNPFFSPGQGKAVDGLRDVIYSNRRYVVPPSGFTSILDESLRDANAAFFFTKSDDWSYEQEVRILAHPKAASVTIPSPEGYDISLFDFPEHCLKEVILGFRMPRTTKVKIAELVIRKYRGAQVYHTSLDEAEFQLRIGPFAA